VIEIKTQPSRVLNVVRVRRVPDRLHCAVGSTHCDGNVTSSLSTDQLAEEYIRAHIEGAPVTVKQLAADHGRSYDALRKAAAKGKWSIKAALAVAERDAALAQKIAERNVLTGCLLAQSVETEVQVRERHARLARALQEGALERLMAIRPDELSPKLAIEMLKIGIDVEREALGLGDAAPKLVNDGDDAHVREAVQEAVAILERHAPLLAPQSSQDFEKAANHTTTAPLSPAHHVLPHCNQLQ
jgi:hypothetical protein